MKQLKDYKGFRVFLMHDGDTVKTYFASHVVKGSQLCYEQGGFGYSTKDFKMYLSNLK